MDAAPAASPEATQQSRLSRTEIIEEDLIALTRITATVAANYRINHDVASADHIYLLMTLDNLFLLSQSILDPETITKIENFRNAIDPAMDKTQTIAAAEMLIKALDARGISKFYEEEIEPPFMLEKVPTL